MPVWWLFCLPVALNAQGNEDLSTADLYRQITQSLQANNFSRAAEAYRLIAERDLAVIENLDRAIRNYYEAQKLFARAGDTMRMYQVLTDLARLYAGSEYYAEAITLFQRVENYAASMSDTLTQARMLQQIGEIYIAKNQYSEAAKYLERASKLNLSLQDTLLSNINKLTIAALTGNRPWLTTMPDSLELTMTRFDSIRYGSFLPSIHLHVGMYNMHVKKYRLALYYFSQGLKLTGNNLFLKRELFKKKAACYEEMQDYAAALKVMKAYTNFSDSLSEAGKNTLETVVKYRDIERQSELSELTRDRNITLLKTRMQRILSYALAVGAIIMLMVTYIIIRSYQERLNANQIISKQNEEINQRKIRELENNQKIETISSMLQGQEAERERIARDLHDSLGGLLSTVKLHFDALQVRHPDINNQKEYRKAYELLDAACTEVRTISNNMQPGALLKMGIVPAIKDLVNHIKSEDTPNIEFIHYGALEDLDKGVILHIYRIVQELLYNCLKHARASEILIQLIRNEEDIEIMVEDDGQGYLQDDVRKGMGTENIASRVNYLKGEISIHSEPNVGTTTTITVPYAGATGDELIQLEV